MFCAATTSGRKRERFAHETLQTDGASVNYEPLDATMGEDVEDYIRTYNILQQFGQDVASDYVSIVFVGALCANPDRHSFNLGVLRDVDTGKVPHLAPSFDNNMALIACGYPAKRSYGSDLLISDFNALLASGVYWKDYSETYMLPAITEELLEVTIRATGCKVRTSEIVEYIMARYRHIRYPLLNQGTFRLKYMKNRNQYRVSYTKDAEIFLQCPLS